MRHLALVTILLLSAILNLTGLEKEHFANLYYAAGVKSMLTSWHNFFFVAFDPAGFITIDKPPLGLWLQALSAHILGFSGWSILLPQAVAGIISVALTYAIVNRYWGKAAGLTAGLALAITPIFVATSRNNTIDGLLVVTLLAAAWNLLRAAERSHLPRLLIAFGLLGLGFTIKSLQAFLVLPAFYLTYLVAAAGGWQSKLRRLTLATTVMLAVALPWFLLVDAYPVTARPYVGSSETNSSLELALGYNGLGHFLGYGSKIPGMSATPPTAASQPRFAGLMAAETGQPGPLRLLNRQLGAQISWLLPFALLPLATVGKRRWRETLTPNRRLVLLFFAGWLIPQLIFFSIATGFHRYYLIMLAPALAALFGIGFSLLADQPAFGGKGRWLLPLAVLLTIAVQAFIAWPHAAWRGWVIASLLAGCFITLLLWAWAISTTSRFAATLRRIAVLAGCAALLSAPFAWSLTPLVYGTGAAASIPFAGPELNPELRLAGAGFAGLRLGLNEVSPLADFLAAKQAHTAYLAAVPNAQVAAPLILHSGRPVMTYGGFLGGERLLDETKLARLVAEGQVRFFLINAARSQQPAVDNWVRAHGRPVPEAPQLPAGRGAYQLYDCRPHPPAAGVE